MTETLLEPSERERNKLRAAIADVALRISSFSLQSSAAGEPESTRADALSSAWSQLLPLIQPQAEPARRACPHCQRRIIVQATRCLYCLKKSFAPAEDQS